MINFCIFFGIEFDLDSSEIFISNKKIIANDAKIQFFIPINN